MNIDNDPVPNSRSDLRNGPLAIDTNGWASKGTVGIGGHPGDIEVVRDGLRMADSQTCEDETNEKIG